MAKVGPKEQQLRDMKALAPHHAAMVADDGLPAKFVRTNGARPRIQKPDHGDHGVTLAPPLAVQKAIASDLADEPDETKQSLTPEQNDKTTLKPPSAPPTAQQDKESAMRTSTATAKKSATKKTTAKSTGQRKTAKATRSAARGVAKPKAPKQPKGMVVEILKLASRANGASRVELDALTKWKGAPWKWLFKNPKKTGYCDRWGYEFEVIEGKDGETRYKTVKKAEKKD